MQPITFAPQIEQQNLGAAVATIKRRDHRLLFVKRHLDNAAAFLDCIHGIELMTDEIEAKYEGETPEEESKIAIKGMSTKPHKSVLPLSFDMLTRAIMAADQFDGPKFEATLVGSARKSAERQEFINSFRYSFLLIESLYGGGQFKKSALQAKLKANSDFINIVGTVLGNMIRAEDFQSSDTAKLLSAKPAVGDVIDHLVEKRGYYFHGNVKRQDAWKPEKQGAAEALAFLALGIATEISVNADKPMFAPVFEIRHLQDANNVGAKIVFEVKFKFQEPGEGFYRDYQISIAMPGTKVTPRTAFAAAQKSLQIFECNLPESMLWQVECKIQATEKKVFELNF